MRRIAILGSTGSIGRQTLDVVEGHAERFSVVALAAKSNLELLARQANHVQPAVLCTGDAVTAQALASRLAYAPQSIVHGEDGLVAAATLSEADVVVAATDGMVSLRAVFESISRGMHVALANKELLVAAGSLLCRLARSTGALIVPVDSEHSAVFQCLAGERIGDVVKVVLTASGGPFWHMPAEEMKEVTPEQALVHPTWAMGAKNTLDSATLMNKGLEIIEASHLFGLRPAQLEVVVHRQSVAHAFVIFADGNVKAQLAAPDMRLPIGVALAYPARLESSPAATVRATERALGLGGQASSLTFERVDEDRFPAVTLARHALKLGGTFPAVLSAANEEAGRAFLQRKIKFTEICPLVEDALAAHKATEDSLEAVMAADRFGRDLVQRAIGAATSGAGAARKAVKLSQPP